MSDLYTLRSNIAEDLNRSNMSTRIVRAINDAISDYSSMRFFFNEKIATFDTVIGTRAYNENNGLPNDILEFDVVKVNISGGEVILDRRTFQYLEDIDRNSFTGNPTIYAWYAGSLYLYPIPNDEYTVTISYKKSYSELSLDEDTNDFCVYARRLIESRAKADIYTNYLKDPEMAQASSSTEADALQKLQAKTDQLLMPNEVMPVQM